MHPLLLQTVKEIWYLVGLTLIVKVTPIYGRIQLQLKLSLLHYLLMEAAQLTVLAMPHNLHLLRMLLIIVVIYYPQLVLWLLMILIRLHARVPALTDGLI